MLIDCVQGKVKKKKHTHTNNTTQNKASWSFWLKKLCLQTFLFLFFILMKEIVVFVCSLFFSPLPSAGLFCGEDFCLGIMLGFFLLFFATNSSE